MISVIETEFVKKRKYLSDGELMELITVAESTPGPLAINSATYVGFKRGGFLGVMLATFGVSALIITAAMLVYVFAVKLIFKRPTPVFSTLIISAVLGIIFL